MGAVWAAHLRQMPASQACDSKIDLRVPCQDLHGPTCPFGVAASLLTCCFPTRI